MRPAAARPPRPILSLCVGITGHRTLETEAAATLARQLERLLVQLADISLAIHAAHADLYRPAPPEFYLLTQLAQGADQVAARVGLRRGYRLRTILPMAKDSYLKDFDDDGRRTFNDLFLRTDSWWTLPPVEGPRSLAYAQAGEATVAQCDILVALWDGKAPRGAGGTADVVDYAARRGVPVIHLHTEDESETALLWSGLDGLAPDRFDRRSVPRRPLTESLIQTTVEMVLAPPAAPEEQEALQMFFGEVHHKWRPRLEYPLLLALSGVRGLQKRHLIAEDYEAATALDWAYYWEPSPIRDDSVRPNFKIVETAFAWTDGLAEHYAQTYRGGLVFNYVAAALSILMAPASAAFPDFKPAFVVFELVMIAGLIVNTSLGNRQQWHRRWLDYRFLAEKLRPMRSLKLLGGAAPAMNIHGGTIATPRWTDWYAAAIWRQMGPPPTIRDEDELGTLVSHILEHDVNGQIRYNLVSAERLHRLDHRLHQVGTALFYATALVALVSLAGLLLHIDVIYSRIKILTALAAILPTVGAAVYGVRGQGDFIGASGRAAETAEKLQKAATRLHARPLDLSLACRAVEHVAATMLADLGEWRVSYKHRKLAIPS